MGTANAEHVVGIVGGAAAGSEAAGMLSARGIRCVVFEQNLRPYGKIEDGLPRWHVKLRHKEYDLINERLDRPNVHFVPRTRVGVDIDFGELARDWGFSAVLLAHGAWRDRPLPVDGAESYVGRGLIYQNPFIYWFNHYPEREYDGPRYEVLDDGIVVGGGLASIDVIKVLQTETVRQALAARGIEEDALHIEQAGVPQMLADHQLTWEALGLRGATLFYRRRIEDMPLLEIDEEASPERWAKAEATRRRILEKAQQKYCFRVEPLMLPVGLIVEGDRLAGLRFQRTRVEGRRAEPIEGAIEERRGAFVISSIGSIPEPMQGIEQDGALYRFTDRNLGRLAGFEAVFGLGNVVTGTGNILNSRKHSRHVTAHVIERFLGLGGHEGEEQILDPGPRQTTPRATAVADWVESRPFLSETAVRRLMDRVQQRQNAVGYDVPYRDWIARVTPPDMP